MIQKNPKKNPKKYICKPCSFTCSNKKDFNRHLATTKHQNGIFGVNGIFEKNNENICKNCGKKYKHKSGLYRHKKVCKYVPSQLSKVIQSYPNSYPSKFHCICGKSYKYASGLSKHKKICTIQQEDEEINDEGGDNVVPTNNVEVLLKSILKENQILRNKLSNLETNVTNITNNTQTNNNHFNINMFLNEKCKNAMNLEDFIQKIKFSLEDLQYTKDNGYVKGISNIFIKNLNDMDITERPIHCSDQKRMQFYVKDADEWSKDKNNEKIDNTIAKVSKKQIENLHNWTLANPNFTDSETKLNEYYTLVRSLAQPNDEKILRKIKKRVGENVKLDK